MKVPYTQAAPGSPAELAPQETAAQQLGVRVYHYRADQVLSVGNRPLGVRTRDQQIDIAGDHLHVLRIAGGDMLAVRLGPRSNDFVPIREGMTLATRFDNFTVRLLADRLMPGASPGQPPWVPPSEVLFVVSYGEFVKRGGKKRYGFEPGMFAYALTIDNTQFWDIFDPTLVETVLGNQVRNLPHLMRWGGTLRLHNRSAATDIYFTSNVTAKSALAVLSNAPGSVDTWTWQLAAGQKEDFQLESGLYWQNRVEPTTARVSTVVATTLGGSAQLSVLIGAPGADLTDPEVLASGAQLPESYQS